MSCHLCLRLARVDCGEFFLLQVMLKQRPNGPVHLISRAYILSLGCKEGVGKDFCLSFSAFRRKVNSAFTKWKTPGAGFFAMVFVLLESPVCDPQKDYESLLAPKSPENRTHWCPNASGKDSASHSCQESHSVGTFGGKLVITLIIALVFSFSLLVGQKHIAFIKAKPTDFIQSTCLYYLTIPINIHLGKIKFNSANVYSAHNKCKALC